jgi:tRNA(adenine34) deaminase
MGTNQKAFDKAFMLRCIQLAQQSWDSGDAPFGSLIAKEEKLLIEASNNAKGRVSDHAEVRALNMAQELLGHNDLRGYTLYTSCEPCPMCSFMIREYKISRVVFALHSPYMGGHSKWNILQDEEISQFQPFFSKAPIVLGGFMEEESQKVMDGTPFFMFGSK